MGKQDYLFTMTFEIPYIDVIASRQVANRSIRHIQKKKLSSIGQTIGAKEQIASK